MDYDNMRQFADSWGLLALFLFFIGVVIRVFWPGRQKAMDEAARIPLEDDKE